MVGGLRERRKEELRQAVLSAAAEIVEKEGTGALTMRAVASRVNCGASTLYEYFADKEAICDELAHGVLRELLVQLRKAKPLSDVKVLGVASIMLRFAMKNWSRYALSLQFRGGGEAPSEEILEIRAILEESIRALNYPFLKRDNNLTLALEIVRAFTEGVCGIAGTGRLVGGEKMAIKVLDEGLRTILQSWKKSK